MKFVLKSILLLVSFILIISFSTERKLKDAVLFYASFDDGATADIAIGDKNIYTAETRKEIGQARQGLDNEQVTIAKNKGLTGDALNFVKKGKKTTFFKATKNVGYSNKNWSGSISFWLQLDPATDLEPGFCDPIQITDKSYNDAAVWVDFTKDNPRDFRLGVFGDLAEWNPKKLKADANPAFEERLVRVKKPPFTRANWTHITINFSGLNTTEGASELFVDGKSMGTSNKITEAFTWEEENANILLGLSYVGLLDELAVFNRPLTVEEINQIYKAKEGLKSILKG